METIDVLRSPVPRVLAADSKFQFDSTISNNEAEFLGYEIYYKLFLSTENPPGSYDSIDSITAAGYLRLNNPLVDTPGGQSSPLIVVDTTDVGEDFTVVVDFSASVVDSQFPQITATGATLGPGTTSQINAARRSVRNGALNEFKRFTVAAFDAADVGSYGDLSSTSVLDEIKGPASRAGMVCFAVSYGASDEGDPLYSIPVWLGFETITFPLNE